MYMLLSKSPTVLAKLREEHTRVFHSSFDATLEMVEAKPSKLDELDYTTAVIRETLRLFPIGFGVRLAAEEYAKQSSQILFKQFLTLY
jgi:cytochrome P450